MTLDLKALREIAEKASIAHGIRQNPITGDLHDPPELVVYDKAFEPNVGLALLDLIEEKDAENAKLREALEFYANNYPGIEIRDGGDIARAALAQEEEKG